MQVSNEDHAILEQYAPYIIAIDGPAASGKGTLARRLAILLGAAYLDTGLLYRATALKVIDNGVDTKDIEAMVNAAQAVTLDHLREDPRIFSEEVGRMASIASAIPEVRSALLEVQQRCAKSPEGAVLDGRDIGTIVCPNADFKFFITANIETRAKRRYKELKERGNQVIYDDILADLAERDARDSQRVIAPLVPASDSISIDTTDMGAEEALAQVVHEMVIRLSKQSSAV